MIILSHGYEATGPRNGRLDLNCDGNMVHLTEDDLERLLDLFNGRLLDLFNGEDPHHEFTPDSGQE